MNRRPQYRNLVRLYAASVLMTTLIRVLPKVTMMLFANQDRKCWGGEVFGRYLVPGHEVHVLAVDQALVLL